MYRYPSSSSGLSAIYSIHDCTAYNIINIMGSIHAPLSSILTASAMYGTNSRFTINPGVSCSGSRVHTSSTTQQQVLYILLSLAYVVLSLVPQASLGGGGEGPGDKATEVLKAPPSNTIMNIKLHTSPSAIRQE